MRVWMHVACVFACALLRLGFCSRVCIAQLEASHVAALRRAAKATRTFLSKGALAKLDKL